MSRKFKSAAELRRRVEEILGSSVTEAAWQISVEDRAVSEVLQGEGKPEWLATKVKRTMDIIGQVIGDAPQFIPERRQLRGKMVHGRQEAISRALAAIARQDEHVRRFRREILNDKVLAFEEVDPWIKQQRSDCVYPRALIVRLKAGCLLDASGRHLEPPLSAIGPDEIEGFAPVDSLDYAKPDSNFVQRVPIGRDGTLKSVYQLSQSLKKRFGWQAAQATTFLLTDITPLLTYRIKVAPIHFTNLPWGGPLPLACLSRVQFTIDPVMTVREVEQMYAKLRKRLFVKKPRSLGEKHLQLAVFAVEHPTLDKAAMIEWGKAFPAWKYSRLSLFARDARVARDRLLHESAVDPWWFSVPVE